MADKTKSLEDLQAPLEALAEGYEKTLDRMADVEAQIEAAKREHATTIADAMMGGEKPGKVKPSAAAELEREAEALGMAAEELAARRGAACGEYQAGLLAHLADQAAVGAKAIEAARRQIESLESQLLAARTRLAGAEAERAETEQRIEATKLAVAQRVHVYFGDLIGLLNLAEDPTISIDRRAARALGRDLSNYSAKATFGGVTKAMDVCAETVSVFYDTQTGRILEHYVHKTSAVNGGYQPTGMGVSASRWIFNSEARRVDLEKSLLGKELASNAA